MALGVDIEVPAPPEPQKTWCIGFSTSEQRTAVRSYDEARSILAGGETPVFHNAKYDVPYLERDLGIEINDWWDTILEAHMLGYKPLNLPDLTSVFLAGSPLDKTVIKERKKVRFEEREMEVLEVCSKDAWAAAGLHDKWAVLMQPFMGLYEKDRQLSRVLMQMEATGLPLSQTKLKQAQRTVLQKMGSAEKRLKAKGIPEPGNLDYISQKFWRHKKKIITTKSGKLSTKATDLREYAGPEDNWVEDLIEWRQMMKFKSTYLDNWAGQDRLYPSLNQTGAISWRFSCSNPNLQNVTKSKIIPLYQLFQAPEGWTFISLDYSQAELRMLANVTRDPVMIEAYLSGSDLHTATTMRIPAIRKLHDTGDPFYKDKARRDAKIVNFGIAYLISAYGLAPKIQDTEAVAQTYINGFYESYRNVAPWQEEQQDFARAHGYVETFNGRPLYVPGIYGERGRLYEHALKQCSNLPIQGGVAEVVRDAMIRCSQYLVMQVHDELLYLVPKSEAQEYAAYLEKALVDHRHEVPYTVEMHMGDTWGDIKNIEDIWEEDDDEDDE